MCLGNDPSLTASCLSLAGLVGRRMHVRRHALLIREKDFALTDS